VELAGATWSEVEAVTGPTLLAVPVGSLEQHGPHLPLDTDTRIAVAFARGLAARRPNVAVAPVVPYGASGEHADFPGTLLVGHEVLTSYLLELVRSARAAFAGVVVVNGHGGNAEALRALGRRAEADGDDVLVWSGQHASSRDAHAGRTETSLMLALDPSAVRVELAARGCTEPLESLLPRLRAEGVRPVSSTGVLGDPAGASAEEGRRLLAEAVADLHGAVAGRWPGS
jgi:mycofactocin precursor peptide peptidase